MTALLGLDGAALVGNLPGYLVTFHLVDGNGAVTEQPDRILHSDALDADLTVSLTGDVRGAPATLVFVGLDDDTHQKLAERTAKGGFVRAVARVHLFWRDTNTSVGGYLANLAGVGSLVANVRGIATGPAKDLEQARVAELAVKGVSRRRGSGRYETVVAGTDRIAEAAACRLREPVSAPELGQAAKLLAQAAGGRIDVQLHPVPATNPAPPSDTPAFAIDRGQRVRDGLTLLAHAMELVTGRTGRGMLLVHRSRLHVGVRPIPLGSAKTLSYANGLISVEARPAVEVDGEPDDGTARRDQWLVHLRGRPDLHPGEEVAFGKPPGEGTVQPDTVAALFGQFAAPLVGGGADGPLARGYITGVSHTLNRRSGFQTELTVIELKPGEDGWDRPPGPVGPAALRGHAPDAPDHPDPIVAFRTTLATGVQRQLSALELADVGEVRAHRPAAAGPDSAHRSTLWQGTTPSSDGAPGGATRLPVNRDVPLERQGVPYATPFAWGPYGLVLPRYPGTRVASVYRHGRGEDPVDVGAVWPDGEGPDAEAGDWWLSLPADVPVAQRTTGRPDATATAHHGTASNDLIDAEGRRVIQVGNLRLRVGNALPPAGTRPEPAPDDVVLSVEHTDGTTLLRFSDDGDVTITAKGKLTLSGAQVEIAATGEGVAIAAARGKDVAVTGANVNVKVEQQMKVD